ncbi:unnamed protein product [Tuber melanosporum]|uniref:(Perigord truffle) hypothetical protein n=1 Tax=Tuber melanosporum (strain Mel28) TaxID=656061 RepID=D5GEN4_TUBMM|nr:uncharacterized protein GSTUM_00001313001 [Tuber melanosporum]CAZ82977.1 unnamed protein product [Tuber melanosporum]
MSMLAPGVALPHDNPVVVDLSRRINEDTHNLTLRYQKHLDTFFQCGSSISKNGLILDRLVFATAGLFAKHNGHYLNIIHLDPILARLHGRNIQEFAPNRARLLACRQFMGFLRRCSSFRSI